MKRFTTLLVMSVILASLLVVGNTLTAPSSQAQAMCAPSEAAVTFFVRGGNATVCQGPGTRRYGDLVQVCAGSQATALVTKLSTGTVVTVTPGTCSQFQQISARITVV